MNKLVENLKNIENIEEEAEKLREKTQFRGCESTFGYLPLFAEFILEEDSSEVNLCIYEKMNIKSLSINQAREFAEWILDTTNPIEESKND